LGDSSLDWGQNLPRLAGWLEQHPRHDGAVYLSYFGADDPFYRGIRAIELAPYYSFERKVSWAPLEPGLYCIGTSMLQDASSAYAGPWTRSREALYQRLKKTVSEQIANKQRSSALGVGQSDDAELWSLDRLRFARLCFFLRARVPKAMIGHMIFVYELNSDDVHAAVEGTLDELIAAVERHASRSSDHGS
jgi:hypothetical protein